MKRIAATCALAFFLLRAFGQEPNKDSLFFLERKTLEFGKSFQKWTGKLDSWQNCAWAYRLSTGLQSSPFDNEPAQINYQIEGGYKWHFLELGVRYSINAIPLGTNFNNLSIATPMRGPDPSQNVVYAYTNPTYTNMRAGHALATLHFPVAKLPMFVRFGLGRQWTDNNNPATLQAYMEDGSRRWIKIGATLIPPTRQASFIWGIGVSKGPFFGSFEWMRIPWPEGLFPGFRPEPLRMQQILVGLQLTADKKGVHNEWKPLDRGYDPRKMHLGVAYSANMVAQAHTVLADGLEVSLAAYMNPHWTMGLYWQLNARGMGWQKQTPDIEEFLNDNGFIALNNPLRTLRKTTLSAQWTRQPNRTLTWTLHGGLGWYRIGEQVFDNWDWPAVSPNEIRHRAGMHIGGGVQYRYLHSRLLIHDVWEKGFPVFIEWNTGMRLSFWR